MSLIPLPTILRTFASIEGLGLRIEGCLGLAFSASDLDPETLNPETALNA